MQNAILYAFIAAAAVACDVDDDYADVGMTPLEEALAGNEQDDEADVTLGLSDPAGSPANGELDRRTVPDQTLGFGCPLHEMNCHNHCKSIPGYKGGYCTGFLHGVCKCY